MSRLLPEKLLAGLFPEQCWLKLADGTQTQASVIEGADSSAAVADVLGELLDAQSVRLRKGAKVSVLLSDSFAALAALSWHQQLTAPAEVRAYATACFEKQGIYINDGWVMHAEFRAPGSMGLAYAFPAKLIVGLVAALEKRKLRLDRVLPVTALAYWRLPGMTAAGQQLILLREPKRIGALVFDQAGLQGRDVEPVTGDCTEAVARLIKRINAYYPSIGRVVDWSSTRQGGGETLPILSFLFPDVAIDAANRDNWS